MNILQWKRKGPFTAAIGTAYMALLDPVIRGRLIITRLSIRNAGTAHTMTLMQVLSKHVLSAAAAAGQKVVALADVTPFAANDIVTLKMPNGRQEKYTVASVQASPANTVTFAENLSAAVPVNTPLCFFGVPGDGHEQVTIPTSTVTNYEAEDGYFGANEMGEPLIVHVNNITAASIIEAINCPVIGC